MKKFLMLVWLAVCCANLAWAGAPQREERTGRAGQSFRIDAIREWKSTPCLTRLQVKYFIDPAVAQPCFIRAYIPSQAAMGNFEMRPAGRRSGVPKGEQAFSEDVYFKLHYLGLSPYASASIEVVIYDAAGPRYSKSISWGRQWSRFAVQDIKPVQVTPDYAKILVRYFIDPAFPDPCYISAYIPSFEQSSSDFWNKPAGTNPGGVAKGQKNFGDNIFFELFYKGAVSYKSPGLEVVLYKPGQNLLLVPFRWGQLWKAAAKR